jgi:putative colanic acid biosynthesis UDP-glucose lipid carrier transferase
MQTRYLYLLRFIIPFADLLMLNGVFILAYYAYIKLHPAEIGSWESHYLIVCNLVWLLSSFFFGLHTEHVARRLERIYRNTWRAVMLHIVLFISYLVFPEDTRFSLEFVILFYSFLFIACILNRFIGTLFQYLLVEKFKASKTVAIIGKNYTAARLRQYLKLQGNIHFYGFIGGDSNPYDGKSETLDPQVQYELSLAVNAGVKDLYVCIPTTRMSELNALVREADRQLIRLKFIPDLGEALSAPYTVSYLGGEFPMITLRPEPLEELANRFKKRAFDLIISSLVIIFILSWLYPLMALLIKLESKGPVLFKQLRSGRNDQPFFCYKFRSMRQNEESNHLQASKGDPRVTKLGQFMRKTSLDEFPQFLNVFLGNMSVVGPRPHMLKHTEEYRTLIDKFMVRHFSKPGITGWAQVSGLRGETKETGDMERRVDHDIYYIENWSLMWDIRIIFLTVINVMRGEENAF